MLYQTMTKVLCLVFDLYSPAQPQGVKWPWLLTVHLMLDLYCAKNSQDLPMALMPSLSGHKLQESGTLMAKADGKAIMQVLRCSTETYQNVAMSCHIVAPMCHLVIKVVIMYNISCMSPATPPTPTAPRPWLSTRHLLLDIYYAKICQDLLISHGTSQWVEVWGRLQVSLCKVSTRLTCEVCSLQGTYSDYKTWIFPVTENVNFGQVREFCKSGKVREIFEDVWGSLWFFSLLVCHHCSQ